ncbi:hypothetical protein AVEN_162217-1 [Araneus ventricosus]|uniref:Transmembrane protein n=1 Tax=Araneus ventricosus TaxID=182803 RepID=A0A4Y2F131_ARAVE|nr:hypothetical protein AVEN_162217-1 [Araneus ventricosus]
MKSKSQVNTTGFYVAICVQFVVKQLLLLTFGQQGKAQKDADFQAFICGFSLQKLKKCSFYAVVSLKPLITALLTTFLCAYGFLCARHSIKSKSQITLHTTGFYVAICVQFVVKQLLLLTFDQQGKAQKDADLQAFICELFFAKAENVHSVPSCLLNI